MPFPSGNASVNRIITYAKGLGELGEHVDVITSTAGETKWNECEGFRYCSLTKTLGRGKAGKTLELVSSLLSLIMMILKNKEKYSVIILVSNSLLMIYPLYLLAKVKGIKLLQEKSEFPFVLKNKSLVGVLYAKFYVNTTYKLFDGLIIMTTPLMEYFKDKVKKTGKLFLMPMTVDSTRFSAITKDLTAGNYIAYCGDIGGNKDGVENLISSFNLLKNKYSNWKLLIIGGSTSIEEEKIKAFSHKLEIPNLVFHGRALREEIPQLLVNAKILVLARPSSLQSTGGFPTKLGEYLSTANPVIVTKVGEIPYYLTDNKNAFLVEPDNIEEFAKRIEYVIENYDEAKKVGLEGEKLALTVFNYKYQSQRLQIFLNEEL